LDNDQFELKFNAIVASIQISYIGLYAGDTVMIELGINLIH